MKAVFLGTPDFAVPSLEKLISSKHQVLAVVTQPDKPVGRDQHLVFSEVKKCAIAHNIKVLQYSKIRTEGVEDLKSLGADIMISCAFGQILSQEIIDIAPHGIINVHGSLLPKYRGAAPVQQSVLNGDKETGVTIMRTEKGIDTGDILAVKKTEIGEDETAGELFDRLSYIGADLLIETLDKLERGEVVPVKQNDDEATYVSMIKKEDAKIDWARSATEIKNHVRGMNPWPCAFTYSNGKILKIFAVSVENCNDECECGTVLTADLINGLTVKCGEGAVKIKELQLEGAKRMSAHDFLLGRKIKVGDKLQ